MSKLVVETIHMLKYLIQETNEDEFYPTTCPVVALDEDTVVIHVYITVLQRPPKWLPCVSTSKKVEKEVWEAPSKVGRGRHLEQGQC